MGEGTVTTSFKQLGFAFGRTMQHTTIRSEKRVMEMAVEFLKNCGVAPATEEDAHQFGEGYRDSYKEHTHG